MSMNVEAAERVKTLLKGQKFAVLCTSSQGWPYAGLVAVAAEDDLKQIYFATPENTRKTANLRADDRVALLVDNRSNRPEDCQTGAAVTFLGRAEMLAPRTRPQAVSLFLDKHPNLKHFVDASDTVLVSVHVERCRLVENFQSTTDIEF